MITIVDYGLGNVLAFQNMYKRMNIATNIATSAQDLSKAKRIILPGVGAFDHAMQRLKKSGMRDCLDELVLVDNIPVVGICVGMQMLATSSAEGDLPGLGWIEGEVKRFDVNQFTQKTHLPHMGWNNIIPQSENSILAGLDQDSRFYFLHSYYFHCNDVKNILATTSYGDSFSSIVNHNNIYGIQCHPEKSHHCGAQFLKNFSEI